jgi:hypothetical protein
VKPNFEKLTSLLPRFWQSVVRGLHTVDHVLRRSGGRDHYESRSQLLQEHARPAFEASYLSWSKVLTIVFVCGPLYGAAMGSFAWMVGLRTFGEQIPQMIYSGIKVPLLIVVTLMISIPSFFVINTLLGLRADIRDSIRAIVSAQAGLTIILSSLLPLTLFVYASLSDGSVSYSAAVMFNAAMFGLASISAQLLLRGYYQPLVAKDVRHRWMIRFWIVVYAFVGIQAAYVMRPFIGNPNQTATFFRRESFENAYVKILELIWGIGKVLFSSYSN